VRAKFYPMKRLEEGKPKDSLRDHQRLPLKEGLRKAIHPEVAKLLKRVEVRLARAARLQD
jgi:hypothetical protein